MNSIEPIWNRISASIWQQIKLICIVSMVSVLLLLPACGNGESVTQIDPTQDAVSTLSEPVAVDSNGQQLDAAEIDAMDTTSLPSVELQGNVQRLPSGDRLTGFWNVNGVLVRVNSRTDIQVDFPLVGTPITITGRRITPKLIIANLIDERDFAQVDRMGIPAILTVFIPPNPFEPSPPDPALEDTFNQALPVNDQRDFRDEIVDSLQFLFSLNDGAGDDPSDDDAQIQGLADVLLPDLLPFQLFQESSFAALNGRNLEDDVIDVELGLITEGACTTDFADNDSTFLDRFPYFGLPN